MKTYDRMMLCMELAIAMFLIGAGGTILVLSINHAMTSARADEIPAPVHVRTINRAEVMEAEEDSGDSELAHVKFANAVGRITGWNKLSMDEQAIRVKTAGLFIETIGKCTPKNPITGGFMHGFLRQLGVQMQVQAMYHLDELSTDPRISALQGFIVGL